MFKKKAGLDGLKKPKGIKPKPFDSGKDVMDAMMKAHMEPDADEKGGKSDNDADNKKPLFGKKKLPF